MPVNEAVPKISIVTVCYNHAPFIAHTIESILHQGYPNLEYIVIDDGSTDGSWEIIERYRDQLAHCERLEGYRDTPVIALNYGFSKTTGSILLFLNSDDMLLPKSLFVIGRIFQEHPKVEWLTGMATTINERGEILNSRLRLKNVYDYLMGDWQIIQQESTSWRRSLWERAGGKLEGEKKWAFDTELWTRFFELAEHYHAATPIGAFRAGAQSKSVKQFQSFMEPSLFYLQRFKRRTSLSKKILSCLYGCIRWLLGPLLSLIPDRLYSRIPFLRRFGYHVLEYSFAQNRWIKHLKNPFRIHL